MKLREVFHHFEKPLMIIAGSAALTVVLLNFDFNLLEAKLYDFRMSYGVQARPDSEIVLVSIDEGTIKALDEFSPLPLNIHTKFLEIMQTYQPKALGYMVDFNIVNQVNPELLKEWGPRFVEAANRLQSQGTRLLLGTPYDVTGEVVPPYPLSSLPHSIAVVHKDGNVFAEDKVSRRALIQFNDKPVFHVKLARELGFLDHNRLPRGSFMVPEVEGKYFFFRYHGNTVRRPGILTPYPIISYVDILSGKIAPDALRGKIVLAGTLSKDDFGDFSFTPYSKLPFMNPKLVIHANILDSVIHNDGIAMAPGWLNWFTTFAVITFVFSWVMSSSPLGGVFSTVGLALAFMIFGQVLFQWKGFWIRESQPLIGIFLGYYLAVPYRLIREYEKRWDYQRKNELLTQVEELKTNFLSLVTHDLKTPVARIQGLAEVLLRKSSDRLVSRDVETLHNIIGSTDELNHFITSILELSKVESKRLQIRLEAKDVNQLIERTVEGFKAPAKARRIEIAANLEPLFPIKMDVTLISKVINTLVDNALKYSPAGSRVEISSHEVGDWVEIAVKDQGIGMTPEEKEHLFTRFYRAKNDTTQTISGTGLGLYLTKYFVEAHQGRVEVETEKNKGSTFKIFLPISAAPAVTAAPIAEKPTRSLKGLLTASPVTSKEKKYV